MNLQNIPTISSPPHPVPHTSPNALRIGPVSAVLWSLVDDTAKGQVSQAPGMEDRKCLQASNGASRDRQVAVGALLFDGRAACTVDVAEGLEATYSRGT